jgi:hypothetical protein
LRPLARRALSTLRPPRVDMRFRKPWTRIRRLFFGCHVRLGIQSSSLSAPATTDRIGPLVVNLHLTIILTRAEACQVGRVQPLWLT